MYETLSFSSAVLGLFLAVPLLALQRHRPANFWIGMFVLAISLLSFAGTEAYIRAHAQWFGALDWPVACLGAFYYCYVRSMVGMGNGWRQGVHFLPLAVFVGLLIAARFVSPLNFGPIFAAYEILAMAYVGAAVYRLHQYRRQLRQNYSSLKDRDLQWLSGLSAVVVLILLNCVLASLFGGVWDWLLIFHRVLILYFVGWFGLRQATVFLPVAENPLPGAEETPAAPEVDTEKYARSGMTDAAQALIGTRLRVRMEQARDFLDNDLTLTELAQRIGTSPQLLSQYLNDTLGQSFFDYINGLRVAEVQRLMADPAQPPSTLLDLALAAGFNSKSTFNAAFLRFGGTTPSAWRRLHVPVSAPIR